MTLLAAPARRRSSWPVPPATPPITSGTLTTIPTYDGSGQTVHPSVVDMAAVTGSNLSGYRWWLADTPYADLNYGLENPSIMASNDRLIWEVPPGVTNPLVLRPPGSGGTYNSDTELVWDPDAAHFVVWWREYVSSRTPQIYYRNATSPDGIAWTITPAPYMPIEPDTAALSPTIARVSAGDWRMWTFGNTIPPRAWTGPTAMGPWTLEGDCTLNGGSSNWHGDIIFHAGVFYGLYCTRPNVYPMTSLDGITWNVGARIVALNGYRPTLALSTEPNHFDVWVSIYETQRVWYHRQPMTLWPTPPA